ncbi:MAG: class I SAM-dependent methyltransferase [Psychrosphaera sp.]|nr:class I SAM-dependent methyltransferase [Psychrosphaera sp.]
MKNNNSSTSKNKATPFGLLQAKAKNVHQSLKALHCSPNTRIQLASSSEVHGKVLAFIKTRYESCFPAIAVDSEQHYINNSFVFYSEDAQGNINSTASLMVDSASGFSEEPLFKQDIEHYREQGLSSLQIGRFIIDQQKEGESAVLKDYFRLFYQFSKQLGFDVVVGLIKQKDIGFHQKLLGAKILCPDTQIDYGSEHTFAVAAWELDNLKPRFFNWIDCQPLLTQEALQAAIYQPDEWENYARSFAAVQTSFQRDLQLQSAQLLYGDVADFGCGSAKIAPFLTDKADVTSYTGIDYSSEMIKIADWLIAQFDCPSFSTFEGKIEDYQGKMFDSAVSLNSYYTWPDPVKVLQHIHSLLKPGGLLVLATPNTRIDMLAMEKEVRKELLTHPDFATFSQINLELVDNTDARFIDMNDLIKQLQNIGFGVVSCHQSFYLGGLNFLVVEKH